MAHYQPGMFKCKVVEQGFAESKVKATPYFWIRFVPVATPDGPCTEQYEREIEMYLTEKTVDRQIDRLRSMGWQGNEFKDLEPGGFTLKGVTVKLVCRHEQVDSAVYERWDFPAPEGSGGREEHNTSVARKLDALFRNKLGNNGSAPIEAKQVKAVEVADEEIPF